MSPSPDHDEDGNSGDDNMCFSSQEHTIESNVFVEYNRSCTHCTAGLISAHSLLLTALAAAPLPYCSFHMPVYDFTFLIEDHLEFSDACKEAIVI